MASKHWIDKAIKKAGSFSAAAKRAGESTTEYAEGEDSAPGKLGKRARLAETLTKMQKEKG
jgi:hypothetical protein